MDTINLRNYPLSTVQEWLHSGVITEDQWEGYAHAWRTGAVRFSSELSAYAAHEFTTEGAREAAETLGCCKAAEDRHCPSCGQSGVAVGLDSVLIETRPVVRRHACDVGGPGSIA